ncbi:MAG: hypothetical protein AABW56_02860 [Nanoarchaeota archaeon]
MKKARILSVNNYGKIHRYVIEKQKDIHGIFCNFLSSLNFSEESIGEVDIPFDDLDNEYIYLNENGYEIQFFITKDLVNFILKTNKDQLELNKILLNYFEFPK